MAYDQAAADWQAEADRYRQERDEARMEAKRLRVTIAALRAAGVPTTAEHEEQHRRMEEEFRQVRDAEGEPVPGPQVWTGDRWTQTVHVAADPCADTPDASGPARYEPAPGERWRTGTSEGTDGLTLYRHVPDGPVRGRLVGMMREPEDAELVCNAVTHWWNAEHRWEYGVRLTWPGQPEPGVEWCRDLEQAQLLASPAGYDPDNPPESVTVVRRLVTTGPVEGVPDGQ